jgi:hypothetical protein
VPEALAREAAMVAHCAERLGETLDAYNAEVSRFLSTLQARVEKATGARLYDPRAGLLRPGMPLRQQQTVLQALETQLLRELDGLRARGKDLANNLRDLEKGGA